ncbi:MAG: MBL fold metallo-hydrolase [Deltaproteobacteria bacterium]|nr:MBL fold metallo-hydrolase [Deltaproteobacteria bacterium]
MRIVLLGTGIPQFSLKRLGTSLAFVLGDEVVLMDCGYGAMLQMVRAGLQPTAVTHIFFTHHHYDHNADYAHFVLATWRMRRQHRLQVYGPSGTEALSRALFEGAYAMDIRARQALDNPLTLPDIALDPHDLAEGAVVEGQGWRVRAADVEHQPVPHALAYRLEADGRAVVFSGDTRPCEAVIRLARGADLLIHEAFYPVERSKANDYHCPPEDVGRVAAAAGVPRVVLTHLQRESREEQLIADVRRHFAGEVIVGQDLMVLEP